VRCAFHPHLEDRLGIPQLLDAPRYVLREGRPRVVRPRDPRSGSRAVRARVGEQVVGLQVDDFYDLTLRDLPAVLDTLVVLEAEEGGVKRKSAKP
jgi:hypothetical protein